MGLFQQRKHRQFNYKPRHHRDAEGGEDLKSQWKSIRGQGKHKSKRSVSLGLLLLILGMIIALWFILTHYETS
ncbi:hypothetical protein [Psychroserpens sp. MEBiC05023]